MTADSNRKALLECWETLDGASRRSLLDFARYLSARRETRYPEVPLPSHEPRPEAETVVGAIRRLSRVYNMVDRRQVLTETTLLLTRHVVDGRAADEVIDELERLFETHYRKLTRDR